MEKQISSGKPEYYNNKSYVMHRKQRFWQIGAPVGISILIILAVIVLVIFDAVNKGSESSVPQWAYVSEIWLLLPIILFSVITFAILFGFIYLLARLLKILPGYTFSAQHYVDLASEIIKNFSNKLASPIVSVKSATTGLTAIFTAIFRKNKQ